MLRVNQLVGFGAGGGGLPLTIAHTDTLFDASSASSHSDTISIGTASSDRWVVLAWKQKSGSLATVSSLTGNSGAVTFAEALAADDGGTEWALNIYWALVTTGTTMTVDLTLSGAQRAYGQVAIITGANTLAVQSSDDSYASSATRTVTLTLNGANDLAYVASGADGGDVTMAYTNATELNESIGSGEVNSAHGHASASATITSTLGSSKPHILGGIVIRGT